MKNKFLILGLAAILLFLITTPSQAAEPGGILKGLSCISDGNCSPCDFVQLFVNGADIILGLTGTFSIIMFVYGGFWMITAYGNQTRFQHGKDTIVATVIGILIVLMAWTFTNLIILSLYGGESKTSVFTTFTGQAGWSGPCSITK